MDKIKFLLFVKKKFHLYRFFKRFAIKFDFDAILVLALIKNFTNHTNTFLFLDPTLTSCEIQQKAGDGEYVADPFVSQTPTTMDLALEKCQECTCGAYLS